MFSHLGKIQRRVGITGILVFLIAYLLVKSVGAIQDFLADEVDSDYIWWSDT